MMDDQLRADCKGDGERASRGAGRKARYIDRFNEYYKTTNLKKTRESTSIIKQGTMITITIRICVGIGFKKMGQQGRRSDNNSNNNQQQQQQKRRNASADTVWFAGYGADCG